LLAFRSGREQRFAEAVNPCISKQWVEKAKATTRGIGLEDLTHLRERVTVQRRRRDPLHSWNFHRLRFKITYQATLKGVPVRLIDPRYTSQECSCCGHISRSNRPNQATFKCTSCGFVSHADVNAAVKMSRRAALNQPYADREAASATCTASPSL
jgi:IS605 OrfB family transposase